MAKPIVPHGYVEEMSAAPHRIESAPASVAAFVGTFESGPINKPQELTSVAELQSKFGDQNFKSALAVRQFFLNGGRKCLVVRVNNERSDLKKAAVLKTGLDAFTEPDRFNLLSLPPAVELDASAFSAVIAQSEELCERRRAFLIIDPPASVKTPGDILTWLNANSSLRHRNAALYFPWVNVIDAGDPQQTHLVAPGGTIAGVMARIDKSRGVWKAAAGNEATLKNVATLAHSLTQRENDRLNQQGINCLRHFPGVGSVCWGARTLASDPEWKYVPVRRFALFLESSIDRGLQWTVFEPNNEFLWANVRRSIEDFMHDLFRQGALMGNKPEEAYFVKCDRTTMTQHDIDNGQLIGLVGFAPLKPAEFVILRFHTSTLQS